MSSAALQIRCYTPEEYLMSGRKSPYKSEYFYGQMAQAAGVHYGDALTNGHRCDGSVADFVQMF